MSAECDTAAQPHAAVRGVPDFFIVGNPKSGTTALYEMLAQQPRIYMPALKEPHYFASDLTAKPEHLPHTLEQYLALFADAREGQLSGEASPSYLRSLTAAANIAAANPAARVIAILREPVSFLRSLHLQLLQNHVETEKDFAKAIALEQDRRRGLCPPGNGASPQGLLYSERVRYVEQLRRFDAVFAPEQVLVLIYDDFRADNEGTVRRVLRFLGLEDAVPLELREANPTVRLRSQRLDQLIHSATVGRGPLMRAAKASVKAVTSRRVRRRVLGLRGSVVYGRPQAPDERLTVELKRRFRGEVLALSEYLGRDLERLWGYGEPD
jgi:hypothetical protein